MIKLLILIIAILLALLIFKSLKATINRKHDLFKKWLKRQRSIWYTYQLRLTNKRTAAFHKKKLELESLIEGPNSIKLKDLTPKDNADESGHYAKLLNWALSKSDIKNLALSGPYGSGKSSILKTFQKNNKKYKFLNISLASFKEHIVKDHLETDLILLSILQQIFYYVKAKKVPDSSFKRVRKFSKAKALLKSVGIVVYVICLVHIFLPAWHSNLQLFNAWNYQHSNEILLFCYAFSLFGSIALLFTIFRVYSHSRLNKLKISSAELEVVSTKETSVLNQHLDEILYFFEIAKYDVVIFEDIDRFDKKHNTEIFIKLRELNTLINNSRHKGKHICFIYAIKDDVFIEEERTKFFDLIVPVIPIINTSNSADQLSILLKGINLPKPITKSFINDLGIFIDDMRLLLNIINEFIIFHDNIGDFDPVPDNLLGMVVYKNVFPAEFAKLYNNEGKIFDLFEGKPQLIRPLLHELLNEEEQLTKDILTIEGELAHSIKELRAIYIQEMFDTLTDSAGRVTIQYEKHDGVSLKQNDVFAKLLKSTNINYEYRSTYGVGVRDSNVSFKTIENQVDQTRSYEERERFLIFKINDQLEVKKSRLKEVRINKGLLESSSIKELCGLKPLFLIDERLKGDDLLIYLLSNGYIDEQYRNYMNYFYPESISKQDREFVLAVIYNKPKLYNTKIDQVAEVIEQINLQDFNKTQLLNLDILNYLLKYPTDQLLKRNQLMLQLANNRATSQKFLLQYLEEGERPESLLKELADYWPRLWEYLQIESKLPLDTLRKYLKLILYNCSPDSLSSLNQSQILGNYISAMNDFSEFVADVKDVTVIQNVLSELGVKFHQLSEKDEHSPYKDFIYQQHHFQLSPGNVEQIFKFYAPATTTEELTTKNYATILGSGLQHLINYVDKEIDNYVSSVLVVIEHNIDEPEEAFVALINKITDPDLIKALIKKIQTPIHMVSSVVNRDTWQLLLEAGRLANNWYNITQYWEVFKLDERLVKFLNGSTNYNELQAHKIGADTELDKKQQLDFSLALMEEATLKHDAFAALLDSMGEELPPFDYEKISKEKIGVLIRKDKVPLSDYNKLEVIDAMHICLLEHHKNEFLKDVVSYEFNTKDYEALYQSNVFSSEEKLLIDEEMPIDEIENSSIIADRLGEIYITVNREISKDELHALLKNMSKPNNKLSLVLQAFERFDVKDWPSFLNLLDSPYNEIASSKKPTLLADNNQNRKLANYLNKRVISSITEKGQEIKLNKYQKE